MSGQVTDPWITSGRCENTDTAMSHLAIQGPEGDLIWDVDTKDWAYSYQERGG